MNDLGNVLVSKASFIEDDLAISSNLEQGRNIVTELRPHPTLWQFRVSPDLAVHETLPPESCTSTLGVLQVVDGELRARDRDTALRIQHLVARVQQDDAPDVAYTFAPAHDQPAAIKVERTDADILISILDFDAELDVHIVALIELYELTAAEVRLTQDLVAGLSLKQIASKQGISTNTVRAHLKSAFLKTKTNRQADLIKMATMLSISF